MQPPAAALADLEEHLDHVRRTYAIPRWDERGDVPARFADTRLVVMLHGMHWTGDAFNTFDQMTDALRFVADQIDGRNLIDGYRALAADLRARYPHRLVAGEGWFDALLSIFPVNQTWRDPSARFRCPDVMSRFARALPHLAAGAPEFRSTGVHEAGWGLPPDPGATVAPGTLRNISFVDHTLRDHADTVTAILRQVD